MAAYVLLAQFFPAQKTIPVSRGIDIPISMKSEGTLTIALPATLRKLESLDRANDATAVRTLLVNCLRSQRSAADAWNPLSSFIGVDQL
jgi:hypothetical protein